MLSWIIIIGIALLIWFFVRAKHFKHRVYVLILIALMIVFYITSIKIVESSGANIKTLEGMVVAGRMYVKWLGSVWDNTKTIAGEIIKMDWTGDIISEK
ncbi:MAG: hypothetical protein AABX71_01095 [Nanoarchaeota archaeon]